MTITRTFKLCLNAGTGSAPYINVNQYDKNEVWLFELYNEDGTRYTPSSGAIIGLKADGHAILNNGTVDSEGRVVITETEQMTASAGRSVFELSIDGNTHGTANFIVKAERKPGDNGDFSASDLSLIQQAVDSAAVIVEVIGDGDPSEVIGEHVDAWLDAHPEATTTVLDGAITAPKINNSLWDKLLVNEEASGAVASFDDGADDVPVSSLKVALEPIQTGSGDPSPTNIRPISGHNSVTVERTGKNLMPSASAETKTANGITVVCDGKGTYTVSGTASALTEITFNLSQGFTVPISIGQGGSGGLYLFNTAVNAGVAVVFKYDNATVDSWTCSPAYRNHFAYSALGGKAVNKIVIRVISGTTVNMSISPMFTNDGTTSATFTEFTGYNSYPYTLGQSVYGGTVDLATGVLTIDKAIVDMGTFTWVKSSAVTNGFVASSGLPSNMKLPTSNAVPYDILSDRYKVISCDQWTTGTYNGTISNRSYLWGKGVNVKDDTLSALYDNFDADAVKAAMTGSQLVYPITTPQTIQLTPTQVKTLLGYNNISSTGTVEVIYHADTKLYVDKMTSVDNAIIAPTEVDFVATRNYTVNDLVNVNDTLYKVTANIASGSAITPNSNVTQTTLGALIKALS